MIPLSVLDLSPIVEGSAAADALRNTLDLARHAERWGYRRYWLAEHHNMPGIASAATSIVIAHVAQGTRTIRVGAGGIMLPNHSPLAIAEQFGTLESLFPGRIDLGLGPAPGSDGLPARPARPGRDRPRPARAPRRGCAARARGAAGRPCRCRRGISPGRPRADRLLPRRCRADSRRAGRRPRCPDLDPRVEHLRRAAG